VVTKHHEFWVSLAQPNASASSVNGMTARTPALNQLEKDLINIATSGRGEGIISRASEACPQLFDVAHQTAFLQAEDYNSGAAAERILRYWEERTKLFGENHAFLPLSQRAALSNDDIALTSGVFQLLPQKDSAGRTLMMFDPSQFSSDCSSDSMLRVLWYMMHIILEDPISRGNGFVLIVHPTTNDSAKTMNLEFIFRGISFIGDIMPLKLRGLHICHPCTTYTYYMPAIKLACHKRNMHGRIFVHIGTNEHVLQRMSENGIPSECLPSDLGGGAYIDHLIWLSDRRTIEGDGLTFIPLVHQEIVFSGDKVTNDLNCSTLEGKLASSTVEVRETVSPLSEKSTGELSHSTTSKESQVGTKLGAKGKAKRPGRKGDVRMHRAVDYKMENKDASLVDALTHGGFEFEGLGTNGKAHHEVFDQDGISLLQRKNQLLRRVRNEKRKLGDDDN